MPPFLRIPVLLAVSPWGSAAQTVHRTPLDEAGSEVEVESIFSVVPPTGYAPLRVKVKNDGSAERAISLSASSVTDGYYGNSHALDSSFLLTAPAGKTTEREILVPVCGATVGSAGAELRCQVQGGSRAGGFSFDAGGQLDMLFAVFSRGLAGRSIADINKTAQSTAGRSYGNASFAGLYDPAMLPSDWRGYSGLDVLAISADEWMALQPGMRSAILQWVKLGGWLDVYQQAGGPALASLGIHADTALQDERGHMGTPHALGAGRISLIDWDGRELDGSAARDYTKAKVRTIRREEYALALRDMTPLMGALGEKDFAAWQVGLILFIFGIVVGPVNLFYLAKAGKRHRLFYTTPLISIAAAVLLLLVIFFQDGTGGTGHRASVVYLDAAENAAFVHQFQVSRTGVLFGGSFEMKETAVVNMAVLPASRWNRLGTGNESYASRSNSRAEPQSYTVSGKSYAGGWFQSRTEQGQILDAVLSTRGRLELQRGSPSPLITSTLTASLDRVFYVDNDGACWASPGAVTTGALVALLEATQGDFAAWRAEAVAMLPEKLRLRLATEEVKNFFYASSTDPRAGMVNTLGSIRWESDHVFLYGPLR